MYVQIVRWEVPVREETYHGLSALWVIVASSFSHHLYLCNVAVRPHSLVNNERASKPKIEVSLTADFLQSVSLTYSWISFDHIVVLRVP